MLFRSMGEEIDIKLFAPIDGKKEINGILKAYNNGTITIETNEKEITIEKGKAASVKLAFKF